MNSFDTHDEATRLADCHSGYALARRVIELREECDESESQWHSLLSQTPECSECGWQDNVKREALQAAVNRRDLIKQAEALEAEAQGWPADEYTECSHVRKGILESAADLRQQAKE